MTNITIEQAQDVLSKADLLFNSEEVECAIETMANSITEQLQASYPLLLPVMIGGVVLAGKLIAQLNFPLQVDYVHATRYRSSTNGDELSWLKEPTKSLQDRTILLIDDILDEGITLAAIIKHCYAAGAKKVHVAVLVEKTLEKEKPIKNVDFIGLTVPDRYVFGYGMDYYEYHRNAAGIYALNEE